MQLEIILDRAGFPMILIEPLSSYIHWLPITKIQIEYFLCSTNETAFDDLWYQNVLGLNGRVSPGKIGQDNYWQAIATGIIPRDMKRFAAWCNQSSSSFDIPTAEEWFTTYEYVRAIGDDKVNIDQILKQSQLTQRAKMLIENIEFSTSKATFELDGTRTMADQMLMRLGVMEYVYLDEQRNTYGGYGQTNSNFFGSFETPRKNFPQTLNNPREGAPMRHYGFRLIKRR
ncbi:MAG: hypothetical protein AAF702_21475 [Chloroflexota bacterium]